MTQDTLSACSECGWPVYLNRYNKPVCPQCGKLSEHGRKVLAPSPQQIEEGKAELRKYPVNTEE